MVGPVALCYTVLVAAQASEACTEGAAYAPSVIREEMPHFPEAEKQGIMPLDARGAWPHPEAFLAPEDDLVGAGH